MRKMSPLFLSVHLLTLLLLILLLQGSLLLGSHAKKCQEKCGNLTISYPFGIGKACSFAKEFGITCNNTSGKAFLSRNEIAEVFQVSETNFTIIQRSMFVGSFNIPSGMNMYDRFPNEGYVESRHFSFSYTSNKYIFIGCDIFSYLIDAKTEEFHTGCATVCNHSDMFYPSASNSSSCNGYGCCQAHFPKSFTNTKIWLHSINAAARSQSPDQCGYLTVAAKDFSDFGKFERPPNCNNFSLYEVPIVMDWSIGKLNCEEAKKRKHYACKANSYCVNAASRGVGYHCRCSSGYEGNPYLGCKDIDECKTPKTNNCPKEAQCINTPGSYLCSTQNRTRVLFISLGIGFTVSFLAIIAISILLYHKFKKRKHEIRKKNFLKKNGGLLLQQQISSSRGSILETKIFTIEELDKATHNFCESRILGKGGLGTVYKGMLSDGSLVAVKKSNKIDEDQIGQFINEVSILSQINHRHIVRLLGCCLETEVPLLVYECVSNGTLSNHLHDEINVSTISWEDRLRIAAEVAGALAYMHSHASTSIFHGDVKSSNILLDDNFRAVISDFGISRSVPVDKSHLTTIVRGTFGYLDPDYFRTGKLNDRSDVYAFGVVLAELLTGQKAVSSDASNEGLVMQFRSSMKENTLFGILGSRIAREGQEEEIIAVAKLAKKCMKLNARKRPGMKEVAAELDRIRGEIKSSMEVKIVHDYDCFSSSEGSFSCKIDSI